MSEMDRLARVVREVTPEVFARAVERVVLGAQIQMIVGVALLVVGVLAPVVGYLIQRAKREDWMEADLVAMMVVMCVVSFLALLVGGLLVGFAYLLLCYPEMAALRYLLGGA